MEARPKFAVKWRDRARRFLAMSLREKWDAVCIKSRSTADRIPRPARLPFGAWWLFRADHVGWPLRERAFEEAELSFASRYLQSGMTVLDVGAHHGLYTLLASKRVGTSGKVYAFEPSVRERKALRKHLFLNRCKNVFVEDFAAGNDAREAEFYVVSGIETGCNSLRPPTLRDGTSYLTKVQMRRLDDWVREEKINRVDFIKLDVEGGELDALRGAGELLRRFQPVLLVEVQDIRTAPWNYPAADIIHELGAKGYSWFRIHMDGQMSRLDATATIFDGHFVAWPPGRLNEIGQFLLEK